MSTLNLWALNTFENKLISPLPKDFSKSRWGYHTWGTRQQSAIVRLSPTQHEPDVEDRTLNRFFFYSFFLNLYCLPFPEPWNPSWSILWTKLHAQSDPQSYGQHSGNVIFLNEFRRLILFHGYSHLIRLNPRGHHLCDHPDPGPVLHRGWEEAGAGPHVVNVLHDGNWLGQGQIWREIFKNMITRRSVLGSDLTMKLAKKAYRP